MTVSPNGASVYVGALDALDVFERNSSTGALTYDRCIGELSGCTSTSPVEAVVGVSSVALSTDGRSVYASNRQFGMLDFFEREASTGALTFASCVGDSGSSCSDSLPNKALEGAASVATSADGPSVYVAAGDVPSAGGLVAFTRVSSTGELSYQECFGQEGGCTATSPLNAVEKASSVVVSPEGASVYTAAEAPNAVASFSRASTGALSFEGCVGNDSEPGCTATSPLDALDDADSLVVSPDTKDVYASSGATLSMFSRVAIPAVCACSVTVAPPEQTTPPPPPSPPPAQPPPSPNSTLAAFENQKITLTSPSQLSCPASADKLPVSLESVPIVGSKAKSLRFASAAFFLDDGIRHTHVKRIDLHGRKRRTIVVTYAPNASTGHLPASMEISLAGLKAGSHVLTVKLSYKEREREHGRTSAVTVTKVLSTRFTVC